MNHVDSPNLSSNLKKSRVKLFIAALCTLSLTLKYGNYYSPNILLYGDFHHDDYYLIITFY